MVTIVYKSPNGVFNFRSDLSTTKIVSKCVERGDRSTGENGTNVENPYDLTKYTLFMTSSMPSYSTEKDGITAMMQI